MDAPTSNSHLLFVLFLPFSSSSNMLTIAELSEVSQLAPNGHFIHVRLSGAMELGCTLIDQIESLLIYDPVKTGHPSGVK